MINFNKNYKYLTNNRCDDCNRFYPKQFAVLGDSGIHRCHICNQRLRLKPKNPKCREFYKGVLID